MKFARSVNASLLAVILAFSFTTNFPAAERELIRDNRFRQGFLLFDPKPGKHVQTGELKGQEATTKPVWNLLEWSSKFPLERTMRVNGGDGALVFSNSAKLISFGTKGRGEPDLLLAANSGMEYGPKARKAGDPWVHLLVEQPVFDSPPSLQTLSAAKFHVEARLLRSRSLHQNDFSPDVHAAQFQIFFTVQNRNRQSAGFGDLLWFGIPVYDNRDRFPKEFKAQDFGGTGKFIFTPNGKTFTSESAHDGKWIVLEKDLLPLMREALASTWRQGFLTGSKNIGDYCIGGMNMGWELPGTFDVAMEIRNLSLKLATKE